MPSASSNAPKKWTVNLSTAETVTVEADRVELDGSRVRATFYDSEGEVIASFTGFSSLYPS